MVERLTRTFVAIGFPPEVRMAIAERLRSVELPGSVVPPENWHITLRFLGDLDPVSIDRLLGALDQADFPERFELRLGGLGAFPNPRRATVAWIEVIDSSGALVDVHAEVELACDAAGLGVEERPFRPHLTVALIRPPRDLLRLVESTAPLDIRTPVEAVVVLESRQEAGSTRYRPLDSVPL
ncbi:MAG TPA: RNA 2',3'-cyclic phosphodiesterase [Acidimicrobiia bacterium]|nr:RNA 2',3'-cyclic phosphodiesterase [Acidimicrobiia bacterium]